MSRVLLDYTNIVLGAHFNTERTKNDLGQHDFVYGPEVFDGDQPEKIIRHMGWQVQMHSKGIIIYHDLAGTYPVMFLQQPSIEIEAVKEGENQ